MDKKPQIGLSTTIIIGLIIVIAGITGSIFFSNTIERFFWQARTNGVAEIIHELNFHYLQNGDIISWQKSDVSERMKTFTKEAKEYLPNAAALKLYTPDGTLAWTDLQSVKPGSKETGIEIEINEVAEAKQLVKEGSPETKQELGRQDLLEVWVAIDSESGERVGYIEVYFDTKDIRAFITQIQYTTWGTVALMLGIVIFFLQLAFRSQGNIIIKQAHEIFDIVEQAPYGIFTIDPIGTVTSINPQMLLLMGESDAQKIVGKNIFSIKAILRMDVKEDIQKTLRGLPFKKEIHGSDSEGVEVYNYYHAIPILTEDKQEIEQILFMVEDITERKKLERAVAQHTKDLEDKINERTKTLEAKLAELEQFQRLTIGRELRMSELKEQIERMRIKIEGLGGTNDPL